MKDLSQFEETATYWLQSNIQFINKNYKNKSLLLETLRQMQGRYGISDNWYNNFINRVQFLYNIHPNKALEYIYNCYLKGSNLSLSKGKRKDE
jgi:hypothetical protein